MPGSTTNKKTRNVGVAKKADRTRTTYGIAAEPNRRKCRVWNSHGHVTTLPMAISDAEISILVSLCVVAEQYSLYPTSIAAKG